MTPKPKLYDETMPLILFIEQLSQNQSKTMNLSYHLVVSWINRNWQTLLISECLCLLLAGIYLALSPRIYEANFAVRLPKMQIVKVNDPAKLEWKLMLSGLDFMRGMQNPLTYSNAFIQECMGEDSNSNRKKFINSMQLGLLNHADMIQFSLRIEGRENVIRCANLLQKRVLDDLSGIYEAQVLKNLATSPNSGISFEKASPTDSLRVSDSFIKPQIEKLLYLALIAGFFLAMFAVKLKVKYRA